MDPNIDPSMDPSSGLFSKFTVSPRDHDDSGLVQQQYHNTALTAINNTMFRLNEYNEMAKASSMGMINYGAFDTLSPQQELHPSHLAQAVIDSGILPRDALALAPAPRVAHPSDGMNFVVVDPSSKTANKRLGRPRKNNTVNIAPPEMSSQLNYNDSVISKFRFDSLPVAGPGSRGGKMRARGGRATSHTARSRKTTTPLSSGGGFKLVIEEPIIRADELLLQAKHMRAPRPAQTVIVLEDYESLTAKGRSTARDDVVGRGQTRTIKLKAKEAPEPKTKGRAKEPKREISAYYDLQESHRSLLALGFRVVPAPHAATILEILALSPGLSPQDFEEGLGLSQETLRRDNVRVREAPRSKIPARQLVHAEASMTSLFHRLLTLALGKDVVGASQSQALEELKQMSIEWKEDNELNPYGNPEFSTRGLDALEPEEKLGVLRVLTRMEASKNLVGGTQSSKGSIEDFFVGEGGAFGRFYMCPIARSATDLPAWSVRPRFKLYVQDVLQTLSSVWGETVSKDLHDLVNNKEPKKSDKAPVFFDTVDEFLTDGEDEVSEAHTQVTDGAVWYEVAANITEIKEFVRVLGLKLDPSETEKMLKDAAGYKQLLGLHSSLCRVVELLTKQETPFSPRRSARKRGAEEE
ncbi:hypothetical protein BABINDRAFT_167297 [Babjeviella inositovora NRRL Y-12698]|uniref:Uncharacterized protein n=1 Tax=Babjeviella inositovora NRRL Y-12698 TaxID=984486 RepID=A0A1E3QP78_9ASCO|nr:uncharacterized protein BABINDRAFT_167297 [Babjeviella inositovora NRRL Y-12698]ODQ79438.1 hypothetical protein BABINDRAFT_167297 [Babjeviella inositovora NRRL Y-12698]